jgi:hypothetical protein
MSQLQALTFTIAISTASWGAISIKASSRSCLSYEDILWQKTSAITVECWACWLQVEQINHEFYTNSNLNIYEWFSPYGRHTVLYLCFLPLAHPALRVVVTSSGGKEEKRNSNWRGSRIPFFIIEGRRTPFFYWREDESDSAAPPGKTT